MACTPIAPSVFSRADPAPSLPRDIDRSSTAAVATRVRIFFPVRIDCGAGAQALCDRDRVLELSGAHPTTSEIDREDSF